MRTLKSILVFMVVLFTASFSCAQNGPTPRGLHRTLIQPLTAKSMVGNLLAPYYLMRTLVIVFAFWPWHKVAPQETRACSG